MPQGCSGVIDQRRSQNDFSHPFGSDGVGGLLQKSVSFKSPDHLSGRIIEIAVEPVQCLAIKLLLDCEIRTAQIVTQSTEKDDQMFKNVRLLLMQRSDRSRAVHWRWQTTESIEDGQQL